MIKSKTLWASAITGMVGATVASMPLIQDSLSKENYCFILMALSILFAGLRVLTTKPLGDR